MFSLDTRPLFHSRISSMAGEYLLVQWYPLLHYCAEYLCQDSLLQAKMGMNEEFEAALQVLRGFDADITNEVNEIKVTAILTVATKT